MAAHSTGVEWQEWTDEAFAEAKAAGKPVLLDIGAVWCHWCHVMDTGIPGDPDHTGTYSDPDVQRLIKEYYIPVKVDNDRRPDINARYNMGGWPTTAFLTPEGETLYGETYVTPDRMKGLLQYIARLYADDPEQIKSQTNRMRSQRVAAMAEEPGAADIDPSTVANVIEAIKDAFDPAYGGFGTQPKFPHPSALALVLEQYALTGDEELRTIAEKTLRGMDSEGMYDQFAGGFFRYSTTRNWSIPHYEKMLEDNAKLTSAYALAWAVLEDEESMATVRSAHDWLLRDMLDGGTGAFAGSQDADQEEHYYGKPLDVRAAMPTPYIDRTVYADWNAMMASSLATRYMLTGESAILDSAKRTFGFLLESLMMPGSAAILHHYHVDGRAQGGPGLTGDQVAFLAAALDLYEATGDEDYLATATRAGDYLLDYLEDGENGGFYDLRPALDAIGELAIPKKELKENSEAAIALFRLNAMTGEKRYKNSGERALRVFTETYERNGYFAAPYARAVDALTQPDLHIVIAGKLGTADTLALQRVAWKAVASGKSVQTLASGAGAYPLSTDGSAQAYVCVGDVCLAPAPTPEALRQRIFEALERRGSQQVIGVNQ